MSETTVDTVARIWLQLGFVLCIRKNPLSVDDL